MALIPSIESRGRWLRRRRFLDDVAYAAGLVAKQALTDMDARPSDTTATCMSQLSGDGDIFEIAVTVTRRPRY